MKLNKKHNILNNFIKKNNPKNSLNFCKTPLFLIIIFILSISLVGSTIYFGSTINNPYEPTNRTRIIDDRSIDFIFNASSIGGEWENQTDAVNLITELGCSTPTALTTNGTDFWIACTNNANSDRYIYHLNSTYDNQTDYFNVSVAKTGNIWIFGLTTNGTDFWFINEDSSNSSVYHLDADGNNITDGFNTATLLGANFPIGLTTNGTDFWIVDKTDDWVYHTSLNGTNYTDGFSTATVGSNTPSGLTTNGSDFWFVDDTDDFIYHVNASGDNQTDGIDINALTGAIRPRGITTPSFNMSLVSPGGTPDEFWVLEDVKGIMYHIMSKSTINNCSLLLDIDDGGYSVNTTYVDTVFHNTSGLADYTLMNLWFEQNLNDSSGNDNNGSWVGADGDENVTGIVGYGVYIDGRPDWEYIEIDWQNGTTPITSLENNTNFTIMMWFKPEGSDGLDFLLEMMGNIDGTDYVRFSRDDSNDILQVREGGSVAQIILDGTNTQNKPFDDYGNWHHVAFVVDRAGAIEAYVDGVLEERKTGQGLATIVNFSTFTRFWIGTSNHPTYLFNGTIDEFMLFNRTLSGGEISQIYNDTWGTTYRKLNLEGYNTTIPVSFDFNQHDVDWKVQCYDSLHVPYNSSEMQLELDALVTQSAPNIGAHAFVDENYVVGSWRFEEFNGSDFFDETGLNNGSFVGGVKWCPDTGDSQKWNCSGRIGKGVMFDGAGDFIVVTQNVGLPIYSNNSGYTISLWVKGEGGQSDKHIFSETGAGGAFFRLGNHLDDKLRVNFNVGCVTDVKSTSVVFDNTWHHVVWTEDPGAGKVYVDGVLDASNYNYPDVCTVPFTTTTIGTHGTSTSQSFNGSMDEVTLWNRSLSAEEVKQLYYMSNSTFTIQDISASNNLTEDDDNDTIKFIYNWYYNDSSTERFTPIAVLNMPFEAVNNGSEMNFSKDYSGEQNHATPGNGSGGTNPTWNRTRGYDGFGAYDFDGIDDIIELNEEIVFPSGEEFTITGWAYSTGTAAYDSAAIMADKDVTYSAFLYPWWNNKWYISVQGVFDSTSVPSPLRNKWFFFALRRNTDSTAELYSNGTWYSLFSGAAQSGTSAWGAIGGVAGIGKWNGTIDELMIWNRSLSDAQVKALYLNQTQTIKSQETSKDEDWKAQIVANDGYGDSIAYNTSEIIIDSVTLKINSLAPNNNSNISTNYINFTYNVTDTDAIGGLINCSLWLEKAGSWELNKTKNYPTINLNQTFNITLEDGDYNWTIGCIDKDLEQTNSTEGKLTITSDTTAPTINIWSPINYTNISSYYINFTFNVSDTNSLIDTCTLWINNGTWYKNSTDSTITKDINQTFNITFESDQSILWKVGCNDTLNNMANSSYFNLTMDRTSPLISLDSPSNNSQLVSTSQDLNYTVIDTYGLKSCTLKVSSAGTEYARTKTNSQITNGSAVKESFISKFFYARWRWEVNCTDYAGNSYMNHSYFTTHETEEAATGTSTGTGGGGGITCPTGFEVVNGTCQEKEVISLADIAEAYPEVAKQISEDIKEIIQEVKEQWVSVATIVLVLLNIFTLRKFYKIRKIIRKLS